MLLDIIAWLIVAILVAIFIVPILIIVLSVTLGPVYAFIVGITQRK